MENRFSVNQEKASNVEVEMDGVRVPKIHLEELDIYKSIVEDLRKELEGLTSASYMTELVAERVISEFMYTAFTNVVKINLR